MGTILGVLKTRTLVFGGKETTICRIITPKGRAQGLGIREDAR